MFQAPPPELLEVLHAPPAWLHKSAKNVLGRVSMILVIERFSISDSESKSRGTIPGFEIMMEGERKRGMSINLRKPGGRLAASRESRDVGS